MSDLKGGGQSPPPNINIAGGQSNRLQQVLATSNPNVNVATTRGQLQYVYTQPGPAALAQSGMTRIVNIAPSPRAGPPLASRLNGPETPTSSSANSHPNLVSSLSTPPRIRMDTNAPPATSTPNRPAAPSPGSSPPRKRLKLDGADGRALVIQSTLKDKLAKMRAKCEHYAEVTAECFFLQADGHMMDYHTWRKRAPTAPFLHFLRTHRLDPEDDDEDLTLLLSVSCSATTSLPHPEILVDGGRATPIALSTTLPPAVAQLNQLGHVPGRPQGGRHGMVFGIKPTTPVPAGPLANNTPLVPGGTPLLPESLPRPLGSSQRKAAPSPARTPLRASTHDGAGGTQEQIAEKAKHEAHIMQRVAQLQREGLWAEKRLPKLQEPPRAKAHWDYLVEEMVWLAADFAQERKWKKAAAKKCARNVQKFFQEKVVQAKKEEKLQELQLKRTASLMAREIKTFWANAEKIVEHKQRTRLEEKRKQALDQHLSFIVDQTEKYSTWLAESMNKSGANASVPVSIDSSRISSPSDGHMDDEFLPALSSTDDEETIAKAEEAEEGATNAAAEIEMLRRESELPIEDVLKRLKESPAEAEADESDFDGSARETTDDEETLVEQEQAEGVVDHQQELADLEADGAMGIDELMAKYGGASTADYDGDGDADSAEEVEVEGSDDSTEAELSSEDEAEGPEDDGVGLRSLLDDEGGSSAAAPATDNEAAGKEINDVAALAESIQPKGNTLSSTNVATPIPFLLKHSLREYQHIGLDWLVTMFDRKLNGILADEMGLGKTIQTISLLAHLACEKGNWGPHLIIVPTSVMLNWEMELKKWCPAFKILTYYGTQKERKMKRTGWTKPNAFHICITSYKLVIQDHQSFRRKKWKYLILDEAQNIKNFKSQRWQLLLNFQTQRRLLLTGTPLQNNLMELWSLMHFLMPNVFQSHREFKEWFSNPVSGMIEGNAEYNETIIKRLHKVLRPFLLRRLKCEVEKQLPKKYEHVIMCRLSKRQRYLYDDFMSRAKTRETLATGNLLSVINVLMQLRKVCNHPNLFEVRPTTSPFQMEGLTYHTASLIWSALDYDFRKHVSLGYLSLVLSELETNGLTAYAAHYARTATAPKRLIEEIDRAPSPPPACPRGRLRFHVRDRSTYAVLEGLNKLSGRNTQRAVTLQVTGGTQLQGVAVQLVQHKGALKAIPVAPVGGGPPAAGIGSSPALANIGLKAGDGVQTISVPAGFAHLVQTSTGRRILLTSSPQALSGSQPGQANAGFTVAGGQRLTMLSKAPAGRTAGSPTRAVNRNVVSAGSLPTGFLNALISGGATTNSTPATRNASAAIAQSLAPKPATPGTVSRFTLPRLEEIRVSARRNKLQRLRKINETRCRGYPLYGEDARRFLGGPGLKRPAVWTGTDALDHAVRSTQDYIKDLAEVFAKFVLCVPAVSAPAPTLHLSHPARSRWLAERHAEAAIRYEVSTRLAPLHPIASAMATQFPEPRLIQYDCGKLQTMDRLLRRLKAGHHRVLIFTQMTRMLDVLEAFLNFHGHIYLRLDGTTKVDQRQLLMERFNADRRIFCFILSTRSGGIGVNLTGADTVVFYDSDWNPTMDAQAQDRCHRIGQTRDVHIYRLVSEMTVEENILKKANQKRLLGDVAIEGGNFTTAYFKSTTIQDLFHVDATENTAQRMAEVLDRGEPAPPAEERAALGALETALAAAEDDSDVQAARTAMAEASADLAEFDENIPLEDAEAAAAEPEVSKAEQEVNNLIKMLTPVERYAMNFIENTESAWSAEQLAAAEAEIEQQKREWEIGRAKAAREEAEHRAELADDGDMLTYSRRDARTQVWVSDNAQEQMPMWCPPTPPRDDNDVYIDQPIFFSYEQATMSESQLPPIYVKRERKRRAEALPSLERDGRRPNKVRHKEESFYAPKSLFDRPSPAVLKMRRDMKLQKFRGVIRPPASLPGTKPPQPPKPFAEPDHVPEWIINEDWAILQTVQSALGLPLNLMVISPGHTPNWDLVSEMVNNASVIYRSPKQCRAHYESVVVPREEGKVLYDANPKKVKKNKGTLYKVQQQTKTNRPMRTSQLNLQDNNVSRTRMFLQRFDATRLVSSKRAPSVKPLLVNPTLHNPKHAAVLAECGVDYDNAAHPPKVAILRVERIAKEKQKAIAEQQQQTAQRAAPPAAPGAAKPPIPGPAGAATTPGTPTAASGVVVNINPLQLATPPALPTVITTPTQITVTRPRPATAQVNMQDLSGGQLRVAGPTMVSVASLSPAQMQLAAQRFATANLQTPVTVVTTKGVGGMVTTSKPLTPGQMQYLRQQQLARQQHQRQQREQQLKAMQPGQPAAAGLKAPTPGTLGVATVQVSGTGTRTQYIKTTSGGKQITRPVTEAEMSVLIKRQQQLKAAQQQQQLLAQAALGQAQVGTLVKAVAGPSATQGLTLPLQLPQAGKTALPVGMKSATAQQIRQIHLQQQLIQQRKLAAQKGAVAHVTQVAGKGTQLLVQQKPTTMTYQQLNQVIKQVNPQHLTHVAPGQTIGQATAGGQMISVARAAGLQTRVIPVASIQPQQVKQTIQVVTTAGAGRSGVPNATVDAAGRPVVATTMAQAVKPVVTTAQHQAVLSQVTAALQGHSLTVRGGAVRPGQPLIAVTIQPPSAGTPPVVTAQQVVTRLPPNEPPPP